MHWCQQCLPRIFRFSSAVTISSLLHLLHQKYSSGFSLTSQYFQFCTHTEYFTFYVMSYAIQSQGGNRGRNDSNISVSNSSTYSQFTCLHSEMVTMGFVRFRQQNYSVCEKNTFWVEVVVSN